MGQRGAYGDGCLSCQRKKCMAGTRNSHEKPKAWRISAAAADMCGLSVLGPPGVLRPGNVAHAGLAGGPGLGGNEIRKGADCFEQFARDFLIVDEDGESVLKGSQHGCNSHGIKLGQVAEQLGFPREGCGDVGRKREGFRKDCGHIGYDRLRCNGQAAHGLSNPTLQPARRPAGQVAASQKGQPEGARNSRMGGAMQRPPAIASRRQGP